MSKKPTYEELEKRVAELDESRMFFETLLDMLPELVSYIDKNHVFRFGNKAYMKFFGIDPSSMIGLHPREVLGDTAYHEVAERHKAALSGRQQVYESSFLLPNGDPYFFHAHYLPHLKNNEVEGFIAVVQDITDRKKVEEMLREANFKQQEIIKAGNVGLWAWNLKTNKVLYSKEWKRQIGYEDHEINDDFEEWESRVHPEDLASTLKKVQKSIREVREDHETEFRFRHKDGSYRWILAQASVLQDETGRPVRMLGSHIDITDRKQIEETLRKSEERFRLLFENMSSGVAVYEATENCEDFIFKDFNKAAEKIEHITRDKLLGRRVTEIFPAVKKFGIFEVFQRVWRTGESEYFSPHLYIDDRDSGTWRETWVYKLSSGEIVAIYNDVTKRKIAENKLKNSQELLSEITQKVPGIIYQFYSRPDGKMGLYYVGKRSEQIVGLKADPEGFFERFTELVIPGHREAFLKSIQKATEEIKPYSFEGVLQKPSGERINFSVHSTPSMRETEVVFNGIVLDITKQKKAEEEHKALQTQLMHSEKMASIGQLAAGVAHEINNPTGFVSSNLTTLNDYMQDILTLVNKYQELLKFLRMPPDSETISPQTLKAVSEITQFAETIDIDFILGDFQGLIDDCREGVDRIKNIVIDLKDFAHPGEDIPKLTNINDNIESTLNVIWNEIKYRANVKKEYGQLPLIMCYPRQLNQVFMNILVNASQAFAKMGEIRIATGKADDHVEIFISDTGPGIPEDILPRVFDPFFTTKDIGKGTGLGLHIAYNIVKKHNGTIDVESEVGKGTTFKIRIPVESGVI